MEFHRALPVHFDLVDFLVFLPTFFFSIFTIIRDNVPSMFPSAACIPLSTSINSRLSNSLNLKDGIIAAPLHLVF